MLATLKTFLLAAVITIGPSAPPEGAQSFVADYTVSIYGLTIAKSRFNSTFHDDTFSINGSLSSAGLARVFDRTRGTTTVSGQFAGGETRPELYLMNYVSGKKEKRISIRFTKGNVSKTEEVPPAKKRGSDWIAVSRSHLASVADPISATLVRADSRDEVCDRTIRMYDGELRADLKLSDAGWQQVAIAGYEGEAVVCKAQFVPISGYKRGHKSMAYLKDRSEIAIAFAPLGTTGVYAPVHASVGTEIGTVTIRAERYEAAN